MTLLPSQERVSSGVCDAYDELVSASPQGSIYCRRWWLDAVAPHGYQIATVNATDGKLIAAWPLVMAEESDASYVMPPLCQKLGILFRPADAKYSELLSKSHQITEELIRQLRSDMRFTHQFHENFTNWLPFYWHGFQQTTRYTYILSDIRDEQAVWEGMRSLCRKNIRKALKQRLKVVDDFPIHSFLQLNDTVFARQGMEPPINHDLILRLDHVCAVRNCRRIFAAMDETGRVHAAVYLVWDDGTAYYLMGASEPGLRDSGALRLMQWEAIRFARSVANRFDFEGSMIRTVEYAFRSFGAKQVPYFKITKQPQVQQHAPLPLRERIGNAFRSLATRLVP